MGLSSAELADQVTKLSVQVEALEGENRQLRSRLEVVETEGKRSSGSSSKQPSRDPAAERERQADARIRVLDALVRLFNDYPWMPPARQATARGVTGYVGVLSCGTRPQA